MYENYKTINIIFYIAYTFKQNNKMCGLFTMWISRIK